MHRSFLHRSAYNFARALTCVAAILIAQVAQAAPRHFDDITSDLPNDPVTAVVVDPRDDDVIFAGTDGFLWRTLDGGKSWQPVLSFPRGIAVDDTDADSRLRATDRDAVADDNRVRSQSAGLSFDDDTNKNSDELPDGTLDTGDTVDPADVIVSARADVGVRAIAFAPRTFDMLYVATPRGLYRSSTNGNSFDAIVVPGGARANDVRDIAIDPIRPSRIYLATADGLLVTKDGGATFDHASGVIGRTESLCLSLIASQQAVTQVFVGTELGLFRSLDGGQSFIEVLLRGLPPRSMILALASDSATQTTYVGVSDGLYVGERGAALFERYASEQDGVQALAVFPTARMIAVGTKSKGVLFSNDSGISFVAREQVPAKSVTSLSYGPDVKRLVVATDRGLYRSDDGTGVTISTSAMTRLKKLWTLEPTLQATVEMAIKHAGLSRRHITSMQERAGYSALLPRLSMRFQVTTGRDLNQREFFLRVGDTLPPFVDPNNSDIDLFGNVGFYLIEPVVRTTGTAFIKATWNLDKLVFNADAVSVTRTVPQWVNAQQRIIDSVQENYSARRRLMTEIAADLSPKSGKSAKNEIHRLMRLQEYTANLDAVTDGAFSAVEDALRTALAGHADDGPQLERIEPPAPIQQSTESAPK